MDFEITRRLATLENWLRNGFTTARLTVRGLATLGSLTLNGAATITGALNTGVSTSASAGGDAGFQRSGGAGLTIQTPASETRMFSGSGGELWLGANNTADLVRIGLTGAVIIPDGIAAPAALAGKAKLYVDTADGDLKVIFADGTIKTIATDT